MIAVWLFWGTTYLGIRMALEGLPPFFLIAIRHVISGGILLAGAAAAPVPEPVAEPVGAGD